MTAHPEAAAPLPVDLDAASDQQIEAYGGEATAAVAQSDAAHAGCQRTDMRRLSEATI
jgi:hypothetical protein